MQPLMLSTQNHPRDSAGLSYVYPVVSRRARGVSLGINLNTNNACNWRCIYCQVPNLTQGAAPDVDLEKLELELGGFLREIIHGEFMLRHVPEPARRLNDIALSGNGEPTSARAFSAVIDRIATVLKTLDLLGKLKLVLITNGSLMHRPDVQDGICKMAGLNGEVWFKIDSATRQGMRRINHTETRPDQVLTRLKTCAALCPTWIQTAVFSLDGLPPTTGETEAYLSLLASARRLPSPPAGVLLYDLARQSCQPEAGRLSAADSSHIKFLMQAIGQLGYPVRFNGE